MKINLDRFKPAEEDICTALGFTTVEELVESAKSAVITLISIKKNGKLLKDELLNSLDENEMIGLWYLFYRALDEESASTLLIIGSTVASACKGAAVNNFEALPILATLMPEEIIESMAKALKS